MTGAFSRQSDWEKLTSGLQPGELSESEGPQMKYGLIRNISNDSGISNEDNDMKY